jgi:hypothetical protein
LHGGTRLLTLALCCAALAPGDSAHAQGFLNEFTSEGLRFSGFGLDFGGVWSDRLDPAFSGSLRADFGYVAPHIRPLLSASLFHSRYAQDEITQLEQRLTAVIVDPTGQAYVAIDSITLTNITIDLDLQYLWQVGRVLPYAGLGLGVHLRNANGAAIQGTIVEDALQAIVAAVNATVGVEVAVSPKVRLTGEVRGIAASGLKALTARAGAMVRIPGRAGS